jgi:hypothetical protein
MEVTKRKREDQQRECRNGLTPPRSDHFLLGRRIAGPSPSRAGGLGQLVFLEHDAAAISVVRAVLIFLQRGAVPILIARKSRPPLVIWLVYDSSFCAIAEPVPIYQVSIARPIKDKVRQMA